MRRRLTGHPAGTSGSMTIPSSTSVFLKQAWQQRDVRAGLLFVAIGLLAMAEGARLAQGTASRMGPGYLPLRVGLALSVLGLVIAWLGALRHGQQVQSGNMRAFGPILATTLALVVFGLSVEKLGLIPAALLLVLLSRLPSLRGHVREIVVLGVVLSAIVVIVFRYGLGLPIALWPTLGA
jgi:hypothetical protein